ncbi:hypothetical protein EC950183_2004, partial [Escherichia coli 95.0183]
MYHLNL